jgi:hypothetical protein
MYSLGVVNHVLGHWCSAICQDSLTGNSWRKLQFLVNKDDNWTLLVDSCCQCDAWQIESLECSCRLEISPVAYIKQFRSAAHDGTSNMNGYWLSLRALIDSVSFVKSVKAVIWMWQHSWTCVSFCLSIPWAHVLKNSDSVLQSVST